MKPELAFVQDCVTKYIQNSDGNISRLILTGHSLGGAYASILYDLLATDKIPPLSTDIQISNTYLFTFGSPWVRQQKHATDFVPRHLIDYRENIKHFVNDNDLVPRLLGHSQFSVVPQV